jgi:hypothetical protein
MTAPDTHLTSRVGGIAYRARPATDSDPVSDLHRRVGAWPVEAALPGGPVVIAGWIIPGRTALETGFRAGAASCYLGGAPDGPSLMFLGAVGSPRQALLRVAEAYGLWSQGASSGTVGERGARPSRRPVQNYRLEVDHPVFLGGAAHEPTVLDLSPDRPDYVTADGVEVWIERKARKTRFLDACGSQVGPVHGNLAPAIIWARVHGRRDPSLPQWFNDGAIAEASAGGAGHARRLSEGAE